MAFAADSRSAVAAVRTASASARAFSRSVRAASASARARCTSVRAASASARARCTSARAASASSPSRCRTSVERALELLGPLALPGQCAVELGRLLGELRLGVLRSAAARADWSARSSSASARLGCLEVDGQLLVGAQRRVALGHRGGALGAGLGDRRLLLGRAGRLARRRAVDAIRPLASGSSPQSASSSARTLSASSRLQRSTRSSRAASLRATCASEDGAATPQTSVGVPWRSPTGKRRTTSPSRPW